MFSWLKRKCWEAWAVVSAAFTLYIYNPLAGKAINPLISSIESNDYIAANILIRTFPQIIPSQDILNEYLNNALKKIIPRIEKFDVKGNIVQYRFNKDVLEESIQMINAFVLAGAKTCLNDQDISGLTPLRVAIYANETQLVKALISAGANVHIEGSNGYNALYDAAYKNNLEVMRLLLDNGANISTQGSSTTALHIASRMGYLDAAKLLVEKGADVNAKDGDGATSLHSAASSGNPEVVAYIVKKGADVNALDNSGKTPVEIVEKALRHYNGKVSGMHVYKEDIKNFKKTFNILREHVLNSNVMKKISDNKTSSIEVGGGVIKSDILLPQWQKELRRRSKGEDLDYRSKNNSSGSMTP